MSTDATEETPKRPRKPRQRISYANRCQEHERKAEVQAALLKNLATVVSKIAPAPGSEQIKELAMALLGEIQE